ncbi:MAG: TolC family protein [Bacteroidota bacterium]
MTLRQALLACVLAATPAAAQPALEALVRDGLAQNPSLRQLEALEVAAVSEVRTARGAYGPALGVEARGTAARGGRSIDLPLGDLLNPVYGALDALRADQGLQSAFPRIANESIPIVRSEGDVRFTVEQPVFAPTIGRGVSAARAQAGAAEALRRAYEWELEGAIRAAYWRLQGAERGVAVQAAAAERVAEFRRVAERQREAGSGLRVAIVRASAEALAVEEARREAERARSLARADLNRLLGRDLDAPVPILPESEVPMPISLPNRALRVVTPGAPTRAFSLDALQAAAATGRAELAALDASIEARDAAVAAIRSGRLPTLGLRLDAGTTGFDARLDEPFLLASAVVRWRPFGAPGDRGRIARASAERRAAKAEREAAEDRIRLQVQEAYERLGVAYASLRTSAQRVALGEEAFRLTTRLVALGEANQADFIDAQTSLTTAALGRTAARFAVLARLAELESATGLDLALDLTPGTVADAR